MYMTTIERDADGLPVRMYLDTYPDIAVETNEAHHSDPAAAIRQLLEEMLPEMQAYYMGMHAALGNNPVRARELWQTHEARLRQRIDALLDGIR
jgi:hypothetical protein